MLALIGQVLWLSAPVALTGILHMVVVKKDLLRGLKAPLDGGRTLGGARIFGDNKTWRGVVFMVVAAAWLGLLQGLFWGPWAAAGAAPFDYLEVARRLGFDDGRTAYAAAYGAVNAVLGLGYVLGELPNSFVKRRIGITPGKTSGGARGAIFFIVDQADSVVAALLLGALLFPWGWEVVVVGTVCLTGLHLLLNAALYLTKVRRNL